jgi:hypothetical protein
MYTPTPRTRVGIAYRSSIHHELSGTATFMVPRPAAILRRVSGALVDTGARATVDLPERASLGAFHELTPHLAIMADVTWTRWSRFRSCASASKIRATDDRRAAALERSFRCARAALAASARARMPNLGATDSHPPPPRTRRPRVRFQAAYGSPRASPCIRNLPSASAATSSGSPRTAIARSRHVLRGSYTGLGADIVGVQLTYDLAWPPIGAAIDPF